MADTPAAPTDAPKCELCDWPRPPGCGLCGVPDDGAEFDARLPDDEPSAEALTKSAQELAKMLRANHAEPWMTIGGKPFALDSANTIDALLAHIAALRAEAKEASEHVGAVDEENYNLKTRAALSPTVGADDEALIEAFREAMVGWWGHSLQGPKTFNDVCDARDALRRRIAGLRARVFDLETQADDRRHENNALRNTNDLLSEVIEEADDEVELIQDLICAPMEKKRAKGIAIRDYIQNMRARAEAAERELAEVRDKVIEECAAIAAPYPQTGFPIMPAERLVNRERDIIAASIRTLKTKEPTSG